jgi:hypothetical protein
VASQLPSDCATALFIIELKAKFIALPFLRFTWNISVFFALNMIFGVFLGVSV